MKPLDQMFKWTFNLFIFLLCFQFGFILFAYGVLHKAKKEQKDKEPQVAFSCGDFDTSESYFPLANNGENLLSCLHEECPDAMWVNKNNGSQAEDLHVLSVEKPHPKENDVTNGHTVRVALNRSTKPYTLVLATQKDLTLWNIEDFKDDSFLKKIIILSRGLSWIEGLPENFPVEYFSPDKICALPIDWRELRNPNNEFRRLTKALKAHTGLDVTSFQGKAVGKIFALPPVVSKRGLASVPERAPAAAAGDIATINSGVQWQRTDKRIQSGAFQYTSRGKNQRIEIPEFVQAAFFDRPSKTIYMIHKYQFGTWDPEKKVFQSIPIPLSLPNMHWPSSMALNTQSGQVIIYNEERGGEIYIYNLKDKTWALQGNGIGYTLSGLTYMTAENAFYATRVSGKKITQIVKLNREGKIVASRDLETPFDFSRSLWQLRLIVEPSKLWLQVFHPAKPDGDTYPLSDIKISL